MREFWLEEGEPPVHTVSHISEAASTQAVESHGEGLPRLKRAALNTWSESLRTTRAFYPLWGPRDVMGEQKKPLLLDRASSTLCRSCSLQM